MWRRSGEQASMPPGSIRIGVPTAGSLTFAGDVRGSRRFSEAVDTLTGSLRSAGSSVDLVDIDLGPFVAAGRLLYDGAFVAERYEAVGWFVARRSPDLDPHVRAVIERAGDVRAWEVFRDRAELLRLDRLTASTWDRIDVMVVPSAPRIPTVSEVRADPTGINSMLGTYTNFVNLLDLAALTTPVGPVFVDGPPTSLTLIGRAWSDDLLVSIAASLGT
jgi:allophanate hydrolase